MPAKKTAKRKTSSPAASMTGAEKPARGAGDARSRGTVSASNKSGSPGSHPAKKTSASTTKSVKKATAKKKTSEAQETTRTTDK